MPDHATDGRRLRDSNRLLALVAAVAGLTFVPFYRVTTAGPTSDGHALLAPAWVVGTALVVGYGAVHGRAAVADTERYWDDHGGQYGSKAAVFCHALGQRLFVLLAVGLALAVFTVAGAALAPFPVLVALGVFAASLVGLSAGVPMNRRVSDRLDEYRS